jgi:hypothetical protein
VTTDGSAKIGNSVDQAVECVCSMNPAALFEGWL